MHTRVKTTSFGLALASAVALMAGVVALPGCKDEAPHDISSAPPVLPPSAPIQVAEQPKEKPVYVYSGDRFRDPFVAAGTSGSYQPDAVFDPQKARVKGIVFGPAVKGAVLSLGTGGTYFIKSGKIFDIMGKPVEGFTAKVFADKVVISGEADNVFELKIRNKEEQSL